MKVDAEGPEASVLAAGGRGRGDGAADLRPGRHERELGVLATGYELALFDRLNRFYARDNEPELHERLMVSANALNRP